ncbi:MAG: translesion error-prone DNA polymerase V autoproteolytic subunit [Tatlockia sp.]|nr:translesion error-prone DNA polymerase V autoproteolytic subunit [Tatlockia sp.]
MTTHGGKREGSGRAKREETKLVRIPLSKIDTVHQVKNLNYQHTLPFYTGQVAAGHPTSVENDIEDHINLQQYLVKHPEKTFLVRAKGDSMINAGIRSGDMLIVDSSGQATDGKIVIAAINGEMTVKFISIKFDSIQLLPANPLFSPIQVTPEMNFSLCGVVTHIIHQT